MSNASTADLSREFWEIVRTTEPPELGPGPRAGVGLARDLSRRIQAWAATRNLDDARASGLRAVALLYHDHHDEAHDLVQDGTDSDTALIHAILHRREPDYWNAKYWFRRVDDHPVYRNLVDRVHKLASNGVETPLVSKLTIAGSVDPFTLVDEVERVAGSSTAKAEDQFLRRLQQAEFEAVVDHLLARAS